jgi:hypothetical protein
MLEVGDFVVKNEANWTPSDFDAWGAGGRCYQRPEELIEKEI